MQLQCGIIYSSWPRALENAAQTIRQNLLLARATETHPQPLLCSSSLSFLPFSPKMMGPFASAAGLLGTPCPVQLTALRGHPGPAAPFCSIGGLPLPPALSVPGGCSVPSRWPSRQLRLLSGGPGVGGGDTRSLWPSRRWQGQNVPGLAQPCEGRD